jgi:hypothetical protein
MCRRSPVTAQNAAQCSATLKAIPFLAGMAIALAAQEESVLQCLVAASIVAHEDVGHSGWKWRDRPAGSDCNVSRAIQSANVSNIDQTLECRSA